MAMGRRWPATAAPRSADNEVLVFLDDDLEPLGPHLLAGHAAAQTTGRVLAVGPCPVDLRDDRGLHAQMLRGWWTDQTVRMLSGAPLHFTDVLAGNLSITRSAFDELGGFAPMPRREDWDLGCAAVQAGMRVVSVPSAGAADRRSSTHRCPWRWPIDVAREPATSPWPADSRGRRRLSR